MINVFYEIIIKFGQEVGMENYFARFSLYQTEVILFVSILSCFFGFKLFRIANAIMAFFLTAIGICVMLKLVAHMGVIVTTFTIVGLMAAFVAYQWYNLSVFLISFLIGYSIIANFNVNIWICICGGIILGAISIPLSAIAVIATTSIWGAIYLGFVGLPYLGIDQFVIKIVMIIIFSIAGIALQYFMNKNHKQLSLARSKIVGKQ